MQKIPTLFVRDPDDRAHVLPEVNPECQWVLDGEGVATRKYDGTCVMFDGRDWLARREVKAGKAAPPGFRPVQVDVVTGKAVGWEWMGQSPFAKFFDEAWRSVGCTWKIGTYELCGPKVQGNPENYDRHTLVEHRTADRFDLPDRSFDALRRWLLANDYEGLVFHHPDGRMAKIKRRDFAGG
ncbi:hypothetical protein [Kineosporia sp. R_H_3]|uniref:hypothetical protein n=1 Tax=Kineosporia sp. R_H_3 TaxID=1961848 RepID=UPI000B4B0858|nr:hypothetical protein [Kineosporia sp. R_H_3]